MKVVYAGMWYIFASICYVPTSRPLCAVLTVLTDNQAVDSRSRRCGISLSPIPSHAMPDTFSINHSLSHLTNDEPIPCNIWCQRQSTVLECALEYMLNISQLKNLHRYEFFTGRLQMCEFKVPEYLSTRYTLWNLCFWASGDSGSISPSLARDGCESCWVLCHKYALTIQTSNVLCQTNTNTSKTQIQLCTQNRKVPIFGQTNKEQTGELFICRS